MQLLIQRSVELKDVPFVEQFQQRDNELGGSGAMVRIGFISPAEVYLMAPF